jgi:hypothetical protein
MARRVRTRHYGGTGHFTGGYATNATTPASFKVKTRTLLAWVRLTAPVASVLPFFSLASSNYYFGVTSGGALIASYANGIGSQVTPLTGSAVVAPSRWTRVAMVIDSTAAPTVTVSFYANGVLVQAPTVTGGDHFGTFGTSVFVAAFAAATLQAPVDLCDMRLYASALTATQIAADYYDAATPAGAVAVWPFDDGAGTTARETVGGTSVAFTGSAAFSGESPMIGRGVVKNAVGQSENLTGSLWSATSGVTSAYAGAKPTGVGAMTTLTENGTGLPFFTQSLPYFVRGPVIVSGYATSVAGSGWMAVSLDGGANLGWFNIGGGVAGAPGGRASVQVEATNVSGVYRWSYYTTNPNLLTLRLYVVNGNAVVTHTLGDAIAIGGVQIEECYPSQATPSPYVPTGAAPLSVYGSREWRQNLAKSSEDWSSAAYNVGAAMTALAGQPGVHSATSATKLTITGAGALKYQTCTTVPPAKGTQFTASVWAWGDVGKVVSLRGAGTTGDIEMFKLPITLTATPTRYSVSGSLAAGDLTGVSVGIDNRVPQGGDGVGSGVVYVDGLQLEQSNRVGDYIKTTGAPANSSGAPRSKAA